MCIFNVFVIYIYIYIYIYTFKAVQQQVWSVYGSKAPHGSPFLKSHDLGKLNPQYVNSPGIPRDPKSEFSGRNEFPRSPRDCNFGPN